ncbi:hypothetical protein DC030_14820 [Enterococcus faecalis]|nr:hypothetical protein DC030_14820 [Enterococcus faecalis]
MQMPAAAQPQYVILRQYSGRYRVGVILGDHAAGVDDVLHHIAEIIKPAASVCLVVEDFFAGQIDRGKRGAVCGADFVPGVVKRQGAGIGEGEVVGGGETRNGR